MTGQEAKIASSGVEELIEQLRQQGVLAGQEKARDIVSDAEKRAAWIVEEAEQQARLIREQAQADAEALLASGKDALKLATRDALLKLRDTLLGSFSDEVMRVVGEQMADEKFLRRVILALAARVRQECALDEEEAVIFQLPAHVVGIDELKKNPEALKQGSLTHFTAAIAADLLRKGVVFKVSDSIDSGIRIQLQDKKMLIDFTDEAVATLLLEHLQPRFRALLQGIVK